MPKRVDRNERRALIADALMRVAAARGLDEASLRHVAAEAGVSSGMVQHYFSTKDEMMRFALEVVRDHASERLAVAAAALDQPPTPRTLVRTLLVHLLPLDEPQRADGRVALAFLAYAAVRPDLAASLRTDNARLRAFFAEQINAQFDVTGNPRSVEPSHAATALLALVEGLGIYLLNGHLPAESALAIIDTQLGLLFDPA
ncbi:MAG TPA: TetR family transcriptional regulator C-terminal domain-containing protein [Micromonosporaceae bacterium]